MMAPARAWPVILVLVVAACEPSAEQRRAMWAWFDCVDCDAGELDSLAAVADWRLVDDLADALRGPEAEEIAQTASRHSAEYRTFARAGLAPTVPERDLGAFLLSNFIAQRQLRAANALGRLEGGLGSLLARRVLQAAVARDTAYREDVVEAIRAALVTRVEKIAGDGATEDAWRPTRNAPRVRVLADGRPDSGVEVLFRVRDSVGVVRGYRQVTDAAGEAAAGAWVIGEGANVLVARTASDSAVFTATGLAATRIVFDSVPPSTLPAGAAFTPVVRLLTPGGPVGAGVLVRFAVIQGGGTVSPDSAFTDAQGRAWPTAWVVGAGANVLGIHVDLPPAGGVAFPEARMRVWGLP
jgi:hypothetical protein